MLATTIVFGGASRENTLQIAGLEIAGLLMLGVFLREGFKLDFRHARGGDRRLIFALAILAAAVALPLLQLIPLPPDLWSRLPGRGAVVRSFALAAIPAPWLPWSLAPYETVKSALALIPPIAVFLGVLALQDRERGLIVGVLLFMTVLGLAVGAIQLVSSDDSVMYFYPTTNTGSPVGFFANRNHEALLLTITLPLAAAWASNVRDNRIAIGVGAALILMAIVGVGVERSRAGVLLLGPALVGSALVLANRPRREGRLSVAVIIGAVVSVIAVMMVVRYALEPLLARFYEPEARDLRVLAAGPISSAAAAYAPFGTGVGSFEQVYYTVEPLELVGKNFLNHAHDDYLELWLEGGVFAAGLILSFVLWWVAAAIDIWRPSQRNRQSVYAGAGTFIVLLVLIHSALDYPLRTIAISSVFAFACALMIRPVRPSRAGAIRKSGDVQTVKL